MTDSLDSLFSDQEIVDGVSALRKAGFPQERTERFALDIATFCRGEAAEGALPELLQALHADVICRLTFQQIMKPRGGSLSLDYCGSEYPLLARELVRQRFGVTSGEGTLPDGMELSPMLNHPQGEDDRIRLCRLALLGVWILTMRRRRQQSIPY